MSAAAAASCGVRRHRDTYVDSVLLLAATRAMQDVEGVSWATALMATPANVDAVREQGVTDPLLDEVSANDLLLAVQGTGAAIEPALAAGADALWGERTPSSSDGSTGGTGGPVASRDLDGAVRGLPGANLAIVSVPGPYAALEAHKALRDGLDVLLFSDNVSLEEEIELKEHAAEVGRLLMGPGAGTAALGGCGLGFANVVRRGRVGVVAAAGTGAQEAMSLLDRWGEGVTQVIGVGGRDLSPAVGGRMAAQAVRALDRDPATEIILLVSKPPSPAAARAVVEAATTTPLVAALVGLDDDAEINGAAAIARTLEGGVRATLDALGRAAPDDATQLRADVERALAGLDPGRRLVRGVYSGGTLCYEALTVLEPWLGAVWSNTPLDERHHVPAPPGSHTCLDLGEEEYTSGRPHPMIDPHARLDVLAAVADEPDAAVVVLDVVLGYGSHPDPAALLAPACAELAGPAGPRVIVYVLGIDGDPQDLPRQRAAFGETGAVVAPTAARAALAAAAIARRDAAVVDAPLP
jgi:FdrA protein